MTLGDLKGEVTKLLPMNAPHCVSVELWHHRSGRDATMFCIWDGWRVFSGATMEEALAALKGHLASACPAKPDALLDLAEADLLARSED